MSIGPAWIKVGVARGAGTRDDHAISLHVFIPQLEQALSLVGVLRRKVIEIGGVVAWIDQLPITRGDQAEIGDLRFGVHGVVCLGVDLET